MSSSVVNRKKSNKSNKFSSSSPSSLLPASSLKNKSSSSLLSTDFHALNVKSNVSKRVYRQLLVLSSIAYTSIVLTLFMLFNDQVPVPYMDEIFHIDQARAYCSANFSYWNDKLTTPPGLYLTSLLTFEPIKLIQSMSFKFISIANLHVCSLRWLRFTNILFALGNLFLIYRLSLQLHSHSKTNNFKVLFSVFSLITFPPFFFFNFLYYTDVGSIFFVLSMIVLDLKGNRNLAAVFGFISLSFRQNNIIWIFMLSANFAFKSLQKNFKQTSYFSSTLNWIREVVCNCFGYILCAVSFGAFIIINHGIVLGDRTAHQVVLHLAQIPYFLAFTLAFGWPHLINQANLSRLMAFRRSHAIFMLISFIFVWIAIDRFSFVHPYLLADNRHFTFYVWRRVFNLNYPIKLILVPICSCALLALWTSLNDRVLLYKSIYLLSVVGVVAPAHLLEFRYFLLPYLLWRINVRPSSFCSIAFEFTFNLLVNSITIWLFLYRPFQWIHEPGVQRFMW